VHRQCDRAVALVSWSSVIEHFLDPLGISLETFCTEFRGSWLFGYAAALQRVGVRPVLIFFSKRLSSPSRFTHVPTGATLWILPAPRLYRIVERRMVYPYGQNVVHMFGEIRGPRRALLPLYALARELALYLATPLVASARTMRREDCAAIICQEYESPRFDECVLLGKLTRRRVFGCFQGGNYRHSRLERVTRPLAIRACAGLIIGSSSEAGRVRTAYQAPRIGQIFNPVDTDAWRPDGRAETRATLAIPPAAQVCVWHGRIAIEKKGLDVLLDAWERLCRDRMEDDLRLLLIGQGDDAGALSRRLSSSGARERVFWIDRFVNDPAIARRYLCAGDVYVFTSRYEGFPVAPIEAMACGLPVVATDVEGVREILEHGEASGGVVVPLNDPAALASAIGRLLDDSDRRRALAERARERAESGFSLDATGESLRAFLGVDAV